MGGSYSHSSSGQERLSERLRLEWGVSSFQGKRESHEDRFAISPSLVPRRLAAFSVFDGHYGAKAAKHASSLLLKKVKQEIDARGLENLKECLHEAFVQTDDRIMDISLKETWEDGSTGLCALVEVPEEESTSIKIWFANAGDCRAVIYRSEGKFEQATVDHSSLNQREQRRILDAGGTLTYGRIEGRLNVARGFGDRPFKTPKELVTVTPDIHHIPYEADEVEDKEKKNKKSKKRSKSTSETSSESSNTTKQTSGGGPIEFIVIASDGVWGWVTNEQVVRLVRRKLREAVEENRHTDQKRLEHICQDLVQLAMDNGSTDNITVIVVVFNQVPSS